MLAHTLANIFTAMPIWSMYPQCILTSTVPLRVYTHLLLMPSQVRLRHQRWFHV